MLEPNELHHSGNARAYLQIEPFGPTYRLYVTLGDGIVATFANGSLTFRRVDPGVRFTEDDVFLEWADVDSITEPILDIWKAVGKALGVYSDKPGDSYKVGYAEGKAEVLREWNDSLRS